MWNRVNIVYLFANVCIISICWLLLSDGAMTAFYLLLGVNAFSYPVCLALTRSRARFWNGSWQIAFILLNSLVFEFVAYLVWYGAIKYPSFENKSAFLELMESNAIESAAIFIPLDLVPAVIIAILCYPIGYLAGRGLIRWFPKVENS